MQQCIKSYSYVQVSKDDKIDKSVENFVSFNTMAKESPMAFSWKTETALKTNYEE